MTDTEKIENIPCYMMNRMRGFIPEDKFVGDWLETVRRDLLELP